MRISVPTTHLLSYYPNLTPRNPSTLHCYILPQSVVYS